MTKERLEQFNYIKVALEHINKDIRKLEGDYGKCRGTLVTDTVKGSMVNYPCIEVKYPIVGVDTTSADQIYRKLTRKREALQDELEELEVWLDEIDDVFTYDVFRMRYRNNMTFEQIGRELCYDRRTIARKHDDYLTVK